MLSWIKMVTDAALLAEDIESGWTHLDVHAALRLLRRRRAMTQQELSRRSTYSQSAICSLETGRIDPPWSTITRVYHALDCAPVLLPRPLNNWPRLHAQWRAPS